MQSGISASNKLLEAFKTLVTSPNSRALLAGIEKEQLVPLTTLTASSHASDFTADLDALAGHLTPTSAAYILLKLSADADGFAAITYVPNAAPVRQKMLFASTRLTLVRELGIERFRETLFATEASELTAAGWARHEQHAQLAAPLTAEEAGLAGVKAAEAAESQGTATRRGHVDSRIDVPVGPGVVEALQSLRQPACRGTLVVLKFALPDETLLLESSTDGVAVEALAGVISATEPRYAFYAFEPAQGQDVPQVAFVYTCPTESRIKERMVYSTSKRWVGTVAERDAGLEVAVSLEATQPADLDVEILGKSRGGAEETKAAAGGFARPKRPGRK